MQSPTSELIKKYFSVDKAELKPTLIRAGAGAGKTTELVRRVISMALLQKKKTGEWPKLVVTTFTRKATQELRERLSHAALILADPNVAAELTKIEVGLDVAGLLAYVQSSQSLHISTIHGILTQYLKKYGRELEIAPDFTLIDAAKEDRIYKKSLYELIQKNEDLAFDFQTLREVVDLKNLSAAVRSYSATRLELGEVMTRMPVQPILDQLVIDQKNLENQVHVLTESLRDLDLTAAWQRRLQAFYQFLNDKENFADRLEILIDAKGGGKLQVKSIPEDLTTLAQSVYDEAKRLQDPFFTPEHLALLDDLSQRFERFALAWQAEVTAQKIRSSVMSMEDLELFSLKLLQEFPESAQKFSQEWDLWLIDEYQDTSPRQVRLIQALTQSRPVFIVGDPQQSIYLFRGARSEVFFDAQKNIQAQGGELLEQMTNYRTERPVLEFLNQLFSLVGEQFTSMHVAREVSDHQQAPVILWQVPKNDQDERPQVSAVIQSCQELIAKGARAEEICILSRKKSDLAEISKYAQQAGLSCQLHTSGEFYQRQEIRDALFALKFLMNPDDNVNLVSLLRSPWLSTSDQDLTLICQKKLISFWSDLKTKVDQETAIGESAKILIQMLINAKELGVGLAWRQFLIERGFFDAAIQIDPSGRREANLWKLVQTLFEQEKRPGFQYLEFLSQSDPVSVDEASDTDASPVVQPERIQLMTVHASKGLQFPYVLIPYFDDIAVKVQRRFFALNTKKKIWSLCLQDFDTNEKKIPPLLEEEFQSEKERSQQELDRVFYVAMTRVQKGLRLFWSKDGKGSWVDKLNQFSSADFFRTDISEYQKKERLISLDHSSVRPVWQTASPTMSGFKSISVSQLLVDESVNKKNPTTSAKSQTAEMSWQRIKRSVRGTEIHRLFESLKYDPRQSRAVTADDQKALDFLRTEKGQFINQIIQNGEVEWGFSALLKNHLIQGQVDLWGEDDDKNLWIIDYKTGQVEKAAVAIEQLKIYAWALRQVRPEFLNRDIQLAAVFPFQDEVVTKKAPSQSELAAELDKQLSLISSI